MADITLSSAVRNNLLALQDTADLLGKTQERLATGLKVNSALDDPTSFFTASALNSRAGDLNRVLDSLSNGIQTIQAADDGLTAITATVEALQATVNQARQDASFQSVSLTVDTTTIGTTAAKNLSFLNGSVGTTQVDISLNSVGSGDGSLTTVNTTAAYAAPGAAQDAQYDGAVDATSGFVGDQAFTVNFGGESAAVVIEDANNTLTDVVNAINADLVGTNLNGVIQAVANGNNIRLESVANADGDITVDAGAGETAVFGAETTQTGSNGLTEFSINGTAITLNTTNGADLNTAIATINATLGASNEFEAVADGTDLQITAKTNGPNSGTTALAITGADSGLFDAVSAGAADTTPGAVQTVDQLVSAINGNANLTGKVLASNDNGQLKIENLSTESLSLTGASATTVDGNIATTSSVDGNSVRADLINQFNELRTQLDKLADDSSFNGVNLLSGDLLKLNFNESGTSSIEIQAKDADGNVRAINTTNLSIGLADSTEFSVNTSLDTRTEALTSALNTLRTQASQFGSNLAVVEIRQDFTKDLINTLETGAANLTLADSNEEGANLLALQTRQSLSTTALSLASQADQNVLRLF